MRIVLLAAAVSGLFLPAPAHAAPPYAWTEVVRYAFESGPGDLRVRTADGGALGVAGHGGGHAVAFPGRCGGTGCPRAILEGSDDPRLDPGTRPVRYGASVLLPPDQAAPGENVVQKGFATSPGQWKLQVDGFAGRPSCTVGGYLVRSAVPVADGRWHDVMCERSDGWLTITVDGTPRGRVAVPLGLALANGLPLRVGGKGLAVTNDQYHGALDDVFFALRA